MLNHYGIKHLDSLCLFIRLGTVSDSLLPSEVTYPLSNDDENNVDTVIGGGMQRDRYTRLRETHERERIRRALPNVRQCGRCGYGPLVNDGCDNMATHHGWNIFNGTVINNHCPNCNWFNPSWSDWPRWNGQFPTLPTSPSQMNADATNLLEERELEEVDNVQNLAAVSRRNNRHAPVEHNRRRTRNTRNARPRHGCLRSLEQNPLNGFACLAGIVVYLELGIYIPYLLLLVSLRYLIFRSINFVQQQQSPLHKGMLLFVVCILLCVLYQNKDLVTLVIHICMLWSWGRYCISNGGLERRHVCNDIVDMVDEFRRPDGNVLQYVLPTQIAGGRRQSREFDQYFAASDLFDHVGGGNLTDIGGGNLTDIGGGSARYSNTNNTSNHLKTSRTSDKPIICKFHLKEKCIFGLNCMYRHPKLCYYGNFCYDNKCGYWHSDGVNRSGLSGKCNAKRKPAMPQTLHLTRGDGKPLKCLKKPLPAFSTVLMKKGLQMKAVDRKLRTFADDPNISMKTEREAVETYNMNEVERQEAEGDGKPFATIDEAKHADILRIEEKRRKIVL